MRDHRHHRVQLEIAGIDASKIEGGTLYQAAVERFQIPENRLGVPTLILDETVLVGSLEIPEQLPGLIDYFLAQGGVDWPDIPGLTETLAASTPEEHPADSTAVASPPISPTLEPGSATQEFSPTQTILATLPTPIPTQIAPGLVLPDDHDLSWQEKFIRDPAGNTLSVLVLFGMLGAILWVILYFTQKDGTPTVMNAHWLVPVLCIVGFFVAGYLAYVETAQVSAVCGPVGDCNTVQQSEYARLFGIFPIGVIGLVGYTIILLAWLAARLGRNGVKNLGALALLGMAFAGTLFSIYLTFLEPFVIGATCAWCLTSAVLMTILMLLSLGSGKSAYLASVRNQRK